MCRCNTQWRWGTVKCIACSLESRGLHQISSKTHPTLFSQCSASSDITKLHRNFKVSSYYSNKLEDVWVLRGITGFCKNSKTFDMLHKYMALCTYQYHDECTELSTYSVLFTYLSHSRYQHTQRHNCTCTD